MMSLHRFNAVALFVGASLLLAGCWSTSQTCKKSELVIINVLDKPEYEDCHIKDSINITFDEFESKIPSLSKNNEYVVYCADYMCMSSAFCTKLLKYAKFEHVWAYEGGMAEWYQKGYPYEGPAQAEYLTAETMDMSDDEDHKEVPTISAEELLAKMEEFASAK